MNADGVQIGVGEQPGNERSDDDRWPPAYFVRQVPDERNNKYRDNIAEDRYPQVNVTVKTDSITWLHGISGPEYSSDHRNRVHQRHADNADHVPPTVLERFDDRCPWNMATLLFFDEGRRFRNLAADDVTDADYSEAEKKRNPPTPGVERVVAEIPRERQENRRSEDLPGLDTLQREARIPAAPPEWRVLNDHRTRSGDFSGNCKALDQTKRHQNCRRDPAHLLIRWQKSDGHRRKARPVEARRSRQGVRHQLPSLCWREVEASAERIHGRSPTDRRPEIQGPRLQLDAGRADGDRGDVPAGVRESVSPGRAVRGVPVRGAGTAVLMGESSHA